MGIRISGEAHALLAAATWACALVLFKRSGEAISPLALNLFKNIIALVLMAATLLVMNDAEPSGPATRWSDVVVLAVSGILGIALADTAFFHSLNLVGVGLVTIVECLYSPLVIFFAFVILGERMHPLHGLGAGFIIAAVVVSSRHELPVDRSRRQLVVGFLWGALAMALMALGIVLAKPALGRFSLLHAAMLRLGAGTAGIVLMAVLSSQREACWSAFQPSPTWRWSIPGAIMGTYFAMLFWVGGFKYAPAITAGILNQTSMVFALLLATFFLGEPFTKRKFAAITLAVIGVLIVWLASGYRWG